MTSPFLVPTGRDEVPPSKGDSPGLSGQGDVLREAKEKESIFLRVHKVLFVQFFASGSVKYDAIS
jgi:hypothetical protein